MNDVNFNITDALDCNYWFENAAQPVFVMRQTENGLELRYLNQSAYELLKCNPDDFATLTPINIGLFADKADEQQYTQTEIGSSGVEFVTRIIPRIEHPITSEITLYKHININGEVYFVAFQRASGNVVKILEALRRSEYRFLMMAENITDGIMIYENGKLVFANTACTNITGYNKEQLKNINEMSLVCDYERERLMKLMQARMAQNPKYFSTEVWIKNRLGQEKCIKSVYTYTKSQNEGISYNVITDITAQKITEKALIKSQQEFKMLADNSPDIITRYTRGLTYSFVNKTLEEVTGIPMSNFLGHNTLDTELDQEAASFLEEMHLEVFRTGRKLKFEFRMTIDGHQHIFQSLMVPEFSKDGSVNTVLNVSRDISQMKEDENKINTEKQQIIENNNQIASNIKLLGAKLVEECPSLKDSDSIKYLTSIAEWTGIGGMLLNMKPTPIDVNQFMKELYNKRLNTVSSAGRTLNLSLPEQTSKIYADTKVLTIVIDQLINNAVEAEGTTIVNIGWGVSKNDEIVFFIKDNGTGIKADLKEKIFEPFFTTQKGNHSGLGLSTARKCVEQMKGRLWCYSQPGDGAQFFFTQPASVMQPTSTKTNTGVSSWRDKKIHVVEDTDSNYMLIEAMLSTQGPPQLSRSITGRHAVDYIREHPDIDLILMDIQLPDINGYEVTKQVRTFNQTVPIIAQTAYAMYADVVKALESGCNDFIAKPIQLKKILTLLAKYLG